MLFNMSPNCPHTTSGSFVGVIFHFPPYLCFHLTCLSIVPVNVGHHLFFCPRPSSTLR
ncbi:hypothetical protein M431DRAFT_397141 [Trichoderma harzianum CBS 226.95]|uniref:Uncharacterized protein n=1 Tax=Trichoderma harzianum CBS 226.95 TaxID=983964 RepID=A0A2T3ZRQ2_TRIHA|nr:hypothetical protein M431DRAFT_397141 [Trichoderma harzianum CBS 226.95]PTB47452.1 hypothetical protein M431DRAFT_397141 [Trichoderma harzianum CBS 226.95]